MTDNIKSIPYLLPQLTGFRTVCYVKDKQQNYSQVDLQQIIDSSYAYDYSFKNKMMTLNKRFYKSLGFFQTLYNARFSAQMKQSL